MRRFLNTSEVRDSNAAPQTSMVRLFFLGEWQRAPVMRCPGQQGFVAGVKIPQISGARHHTSTCGGRTGARHGHGRPREPRAGRQAALAQVDAHALPSLKGANGQVKQSNCDNSKTTGSWLDEQVLLNGGVGALSTLCLVRAPATCSAPWPRPCPAVVHGRFKLSARVAKSGFYCSFS